MMRLCLLLLLFAPAFVAEESSFALWSPAAIGQREAALMKNVAPDHSSRETLADYGDHRFRLLYRDADGLPEEHDKIVDVVVVHSGEGALILGGTMSLEIEGQPYTAGPGTLVVFPAGVPHRNWNGGTEPKPLTKSSRRADRISAFFRI